MILPEQVVYQVAALVAASGIVGIAVEARRTRQAVEKHDRVLFGTSHRKGLVEKVSELREFWRQRRGGKRDA